METAGEERDTHKGHESTALVPNGEQRLSSGPVSSSELQGCITTKVDVF